MIPVYVVYVGATYVDAGMLFVILLNRVLLLRNKYVYIRQFLFDFQNNTLRSRQSVKKYMRDFLFMSSCIYIEESR